ncbi:MAG TPA: RNB domain-containing ribonuclease, partial [Candidatus Wallbacteria bacterium]|nr:RNB domain-containing ribonuclease [Candidatus Wallbacteria bacterium]
ETGQTYDAALAWAIRRNMQFAETSYAPSAHGMLGTACYIQSSSPLRRYIDMLNQRQIKSLVIDGRPFYEEEAVRKISQYLDATLASISEAEQESHYYWLYLYLKQNAGMVYEGVVIEASEERARIEIAGVFLHVTAQARIHGKFCAGEKVAVTVENADARARKVFFKAVALDKLAG